MAVKELGMLSSQLIDGYQVLETWLLSVKMLYKLKFEELAQNVKDLNDFYFTFLNYSISGI